MSIDSLDLDFEPNQIIAITGPNGSGKSSFYNAVSFAITGHRQGESVKDYVKAGCEKALIKMDTLFKGVPLSYSVEIFNSKKHPQPTNKIINYNGKVYINSDYSQFIAENKIDEAESLMFMFQGNNSIIESRPAERAALLKRLFRVEFPELVNDLKTELDQKKMETAEYSAVLNELKSATYEKSPLLREVAPINISNWEKRFQEIGVNLNLIGDTNENEIRECESELLSSKKFLSSQMSKTREDRASLSKLESQLKDLEISLNKRDLADLNKELDGLKREQAEHDKKYQEDQAIYFEMSSDLKILISKKAELEAHYETSKTGGTCHACGQTIDKKHLDNLVKQIQETENLVEAKRKEIKELEFDPRNAKGKELSKKLQYTEDLIKGYNNDLKTKESILVRIDGLRDLITERDTTISQIEKKISLLEKKKSSLSEMEGLIKEKANLIKERDEIQEKLQTARDNLIKNEERRIANRRIDEEKEKRDNKINDLTERINQCSISITRLKRQIDIFEKEFPNYIVLQACQQLEEVINEIVQRVFPYCRVSLKLSKGGVNFYYTPENSEGEWITVSMASGAQKMIITLSYFIALAKMSGMSSIFLDEIDASCSQENSKIIYEFLSKINLFSQVFFITHKPESIELVKEINPNVRVFYVDKGEYEEM